MFFGTTLYITSLPVRPVAVHTKVTHGQIVIYTVWLVSISTWQDGVNALVLLLAHIRYYYILNGYTYGTLSVSANDDCIATSTTYIKNTKENRNASI